MASSGPFYQEITLEPEIIGGAVPGVARMPNGDILAIWSDTENVLGARSSDAGVSWSGAEVLAPSVDGDPALLAARRGTALHFSKGEMIMGEGGDAPRYRRSTLYRMGSDDGGCTFGPATRIDTGRLYNGHANEGLELRDGTLVMPYYYVQNLEGGGEVYEREMVCVSSVLTSTDSGSSWQSGGEVRLPHDPNGSDEPAVVELGDGDLLMIVRSTRGRHYQSRSSDRGATWSDPVPTLLVASNTPAALHRLSFEPSAVVVVWTSTPYVGAMNRYPLSVAISYDECVSWAHHRILTNPGCQVSYPGVTSADDGTILVIWQQWLAKTFHFPPYTSIRVRLKCARFSEDWLREGASL